MRAFPIDPPEIGYYWWLDLDVVADYLRRGIGEAAAQNAGQYLDVFSDFALEYIGAWKQDPYVIQEEPA